VAGTSEELSRHAGRLSRTALDARDASGSTIADVMAKEAGFEASETNLASIAHRGHISAYVEVHIEQGPILQMEDKPVGIVNSIVGQKRLQVQLSGEQGHAGNAQPCTLQTLNVLEDCCAEDFQAHQPKGLCLHSCAFLKDSCTLPVKLQSGACRKPIPTKSMPRTATDLGFVLK
jgi:hypothetical protein